MRTLWPVTVGGRKGESNYTVIYHREIKRLQAAETPAEPGNECLPALTALPGSSPFGKGPGLAW
jgi:hypothetical protein